MLFKTITHEPIRRGDITLTIRRWRAPQAKVGGQYRLHTGGAVEVTSVEVIGDADLTEADAQAAGFRSLAMLGRW
ncbi:MAG: ASCH domain-containing protein, partial [Dehalococcoidia bacterium]|nr:ASCH domain-containing protein [Dehalococcoidia bacterium]